MRSPGRTERARRASRFRARLGEASMETATAVPRASPRAPRAFRADTDTVASGSRTSFATISNPLGSLSAPRPRAAIARDRGSSLSAAARRIGFIEGSSRRMAVQVAAHQSKRGLPPERRTASAAGASFKAASANKPRRSSTQGSDGFPGSSPRTVTTARLWGIAAWRKATRSPAARLSPRRPSASAARARTVTSLSLRAARSRSTACLSPRRPRAKAVICRTSGS